MLINRVNHQPGQLGRSQKFDFGTFQNNSIAEIILLKIMIVME